MTCRAVSNFRKDVESSKSCHSAASFLEKPAGLAGIQSDETPSALRRIIKG